MLVIVKPTPNPKPEAGREGRAGRGVHHQVREADGSRRRAEGEPTMEGVDRFKSFYQESTTAPRDKLTFGNPFQHSGVVGQCVA